MGIYFSLFFSGFIAATLLPAFSELALATLVAQDYSPALLWVSATAGNSLGACVNWGLGYYVRGFADHPRFPMSSKNLLKADRIFNRYGKWVLLFAWLPIIGDPLTFVAGTTRLRFAWFVSLVTIGKGVRYAVVIAITLALG